MKLIFELHDALEESVYRLKSLRAGRARMIRVWPRRERVLSDGNLAAGLGLSNWSY